MGIEKNLEKAEEYYKKTLDSEKDASYQIIKAVYLIKDETYR
jgi:hypothetical protein